MGKLKSSLFSGRVKKGLTKMEGALLRFLERPPT
jgi:hypothetical protein